jgi:LytS/YehU family sensor histidine kinase
MGIMHIVNDERRFDVTNDPTALILASLSAAFLLWLTLIAAYRLDRTDAVAVSSATVLLVMPPLISYYLLMEIAKKRLSISVRVVCTYVLAVAWLFVQRAVIYPAFRLGWSLGESIANLILLPAFGIATWLAVRSFCDRRHLARALELQQQTELRLLYAQLAPHALFNMLNTVYSVLLTDHEEAVPLFLAMSEALRHVVDHTRKHWIPLNEELDFIQHYAVLERARSPQGVVIRVNTEGDLDVPVPPMLLATLFENAVKHGRFPDGSLEIEVSVRIDEANMQFHVVNRFPPSMEADSGMGLGQRNVQDRLQLLYADRGLFRTHIEEGAYHASIEIVL